MAANGWQQEMTWITILYYILEKKKAFDAIILESVLQFLEPDLKTMFHEDLLAIDEKTGNYIVTDKGKAALAKVVAMYDHVRRFEVFKDVDLTCQLQEGDFNPEKPAFVFDDLFDPRFNGKSGEPGVEDLRLAMMTYFAETTAEKLPAPLDPHRVVFIQKLLAGNFANDDQAFWEALGTGTFATSIDEIVESAYKWRDLEPTNEKLAREYASNLYAAGMCESNKRKGDTCSKCNKPLAMAELDGPVSKCPWCDHEFGGPGGGGAGGGGEECPSCHAEIAPSDTFCRGCGARIDRTLAPGTVATETVVTEEVVETPVFAYDYGCYGYDPYGYYYPFDPVYDAVAFGVLCAVLW